MIKYSSPGIDPHIFKFTPSLKKTGIDIYGFVICKDMKKKISEICSELDIKSIPKKMFNDYLLNSDFEKTLYTNKFELLFIGLNKLKNCSSKDLYKIYGEMGVAFSKKEESSNSCIYLVGEDKNQIRNNVISYVLGFYNFIDFKTNNDSKFKKGLSYFYIQKKYNNKTIKELINNSIYEACTQNMVRSLINTPPNILNSSSYISFIKNNLPDGVSLKILDEKKLKKLGLNLILGVGQGSSNNSALLILEYSHGKADKPICLIGKGVMFDSGGYNLKYGDFSNMKNDKAGSAIVFGIFKLISHFKIEGKYIGLLPIVENMVDSKSTRPGDIQICYNKKTVEIVDTDAEGRLIIADSLAYSHKFKPYMCLDIATLTGQASSIFGNKSTVIMGNNNKYIQKMILAGEKNHENIWELPMWEEYVSLTKSNIADFRNHSNEISAGTIMAGAFLSNFVPSGVKWIHLDIAGVDEIKNDSSTRYYGAIGESMRTVFYFLKNFNKEVYE